MPSSSPHVVLLLVFLLVPFLFLPSLAAAGVQPLQSNGTTIYDVLPDYALPPGILPDMVKSYSIASNGRIEVTLYTSCYVDFEYVIYYEPRVSGYLSYGSISNLEGIQIRSYLIWYDVNAIMVDVPSSEYIYFQFGWVTRKLGIDQFQHIHSCRGSLSLFQRAKKVVRNVFESIFAPQL
ncbi:hypothetical protein Cni_G12931 [Canna indica]|uniref:Uncharacterized protein n=1 Tax=Canna indica TaxID=4628 RepID=A0AAQ3K990_9LILI|nr:hypothetical protein Cni_G12931 [Canna indica]